jgi:signal transduction histidine kinase
MSLNFKNRISIYYLTATAIIIAVVFGIVFLIVKNTVYQNLDNDLSFEAKKHTKEITIRGDSIFFINKIEWEEHEHREAQVNPVFIQLLNKKGRLMDKSPNLKEQYLPFDYNKVLGDHFDAEFNDRSIRQVQIPIIQKEKVKGYIVAAMSLESSAMVIKNLRNVLLISFPIILIGLFFISRYLAGRSIIPIQNLTKTTNRITKNNLNERVELPTNKDELYALSTSFNELLQRIENAIFRERQFTSDASHELRTPLASLRGTLEVLIRKPRTEAEYKDKINYSLSEIDRMTDIVEQLLLLARFDSENTIQEIQNENLVTLISNILEHQNNEINTKNITIKFDSQSTKNEMVPSYYANLILDNLISNAVKYSDQNGKINITIHESEGAIICKIMDEGMGIAEEDLNNIFSPFFRSDALNHKHVVGNGLGLSIAKKAAKAIKADVFVESELGKGTTFTVKF